MKSVILFPKTRALAKQYVDQAQDGQMMTIKDVTRTLEQNAKFHAVCEDVAKSGMKWMDKTRTAGQWKVLFVSGHTVATAGSADMVPGLENEFVNLRESTAGMSVKRLSSLLEYTLAWCANHEVNNSND